MDDTPKTSLSHPAILIASARDSRPPLSEPGYSASLAELIDRAESVGADDETVTDSLVRDVIIAHQDAAVASVMEGRR